ncbi:MAG: T9SS type A sorting domain-containing protein [Bacteroidia bacterium]
MKKPLQSKLKSYSALAGSFALFGSQTDAQIVYTNINPDSTVNVGGGLYNLDLDNDGTFDFTINLNIGTASTTSQQVSVTNVGSNGVAGDTVGMYIYPFALNAGDTIKSSLQFNLGVNQSMGSYFAAGGSAFGHWLGATDKYLGLSFHIGTTLHYGWARLDVDSLAGHFTIKDYAYNTVADSMIIAGQTGTLGINENTFSKGLSIYSSGKNVNIHFLNELPIDADVKILNVLGQTVYTSGLSNKETIIGLNEVKTGIYFVTVTQKNGVYTKKVQIQ